MAALADVEIQDFLKRYAPRSFKGVFSCDEFRSEQFYFLPIAVVVNALPSTVEMGHWSAIYVDVNRNGTWFDSFGLRPWGKFNSFLAKNSINATFNTELLQKDEISCGHHAIFLYVRWIKAGAWETYSLCIAATRVTPMTSWLKNITTNVNHTSRQ